MTFDSKRKMMLTVSGLLVAFVLLGGVLGRSLAVEGTYSYLKLFNEVLYLVRNNYVEATDDQTLMEGAYRGMLENLDPLGEYLTATEFRLLEYLMRHLDSVVSTTALARHVWGYDDPPARDVVRVTVHRLRRKLGDDGESPRFVHTVPGVGLKLRSIPSQRAS